jgi:hypothetical protein
MDPHMLADVNIGVIAAPIWLGKVNTGPHIHAHVNIVIGIQN